MSLPKEGKIKGINKAHNLLSEGTKIEPYCRRCMNRSEDAKNVGPPQKNILDLLVS